jgi:hypothetical protein
MSYIPLTITTLFDQPYLVMIDVPTKPGTQPSSALGMNIARYPIGRPYYTCGNRTMVLAKFAMQDGIRGVYYPILSRSRQCAVLPLLIAVNTHDPLLWLTGAALTSARSTPSSVLLNWGALLGASPLVPRSKIGGGRKAIALDYDLNRCTCTLIITCLLDCLS